ncbi:MAG: response regulator [bacterium]|nr:response regulator [bacterium]
MPEAKDNSPASFLIVEDNKNIRKLYSTLIMLKYSGVATAFAENGHEGLEACKSSDPSLIIADIKMPVMDGIEFHRQLKKSSPRLAGRVAFISATFSDLHLDYINDNNCRYLIKPFETDAFNELIDSMLMSRGEKAGNIPD